MGGASGSAPPPDTVLEDFPRLSIMVALPKKFRGDGEDLKPKAFARW